MERSIKRRDGAFEGWWWLKVTRYLIANKCTKVLFKSTYSKLWYTFWNCGQCQAKKSSVMSHLCFCLPLRPGSTVVQSILVELVELNRRAEHSRPAGPRPTGKQTHLELKRGKKGRKGGARSNTWRPTMRFHPGEGLWFIPLLSLLYGVNKKGFYVPLPLWMFMICKFFLLSFSSCDYI